MQAPGGPEEDTSNGFTQGGWTMQFSDDLSKKTVLDIVATGLNYSFLGRRTYEIFAGHWPEHGDHPIGKAFNKATKHVATRSLKQLDWENSRPITGDLVDELRQLKKSDGPSLHIWGSSTLLLTLSAAGLSSTNTAPGYSPSSSAEENASSRTPSPRAPSPSSQRKPTQRRRPKHLPSRPNRPNLITQA